MTFVIAVASQKGGVAKTSTVVSLGGALVKNGYEVLLVDLDAQADLTLSLGIDPARVRRSVVDVLLNSGNLVSISRETSLPGLDLIPSNAEMELAERFLPIRKNYEFVLRDAINHPQIQAVYDYILIDCPPSLGAVTQNALNTARLLVIPTQPEYFSAHALKNMVPIIQRIQSLNNPGLGFRILITMHDCRNRIHRSVREQLEITFNGTLLRTLIDTDTKLRESAAAGLPVTHFYPNSRGAQQYDQLAQELIQYAQKSGS